MAENVLGPAAFHMRAFSEAAEGESWKPDHDDAMACRDLEGLLRLGVSAYENTMDQFRKWAKAVLDGDEPYSPGRHLDVWKGVRDWLGSASVVDAAVVECLKRYAEVEGAEDFRRCRDEAGRFVSGPADSLWALRVPFPAVSGEGAFAVEFDEKELAKLAAADSPANARAFPGDENL